MTVTISSLGIPGYSYTDLHDPERLSSLYERFCEQVSADNPALWREWDAYRRDPDAPRSPVALSNLLIAMAPHVSRFVTRLFDVDRPLAAIVRATQEQDALFRFKVDFVRRRALPLLKGGAHVVSTPDDEAIVEVMIATAGTTDRELAVAKSGCELLDREKTASPQPPAPGRDSEALKRWCAARIHDPAYRDWVIFR